MSTAETMRGPPLAPTTARRLPSGPLSIMGDMLLSGFFPGLMKFAGLGASPYTFSFPGVEKSSIWLLNRMPGSSERWLRGAY